MSCLPSLSNCVLRHPERWAGLTDEIRRIDLVLTTSPEEVKDKCKTLCESVIKTMLVASGTKTEEECEYADMNGLKNWTCAFLILEDRDEKVVKAEITYLYESRNNAGTGGHGRSLQRQREIRERVDERENERYLSVTDSLLSDLVNRYEKQYPGEEQEELRDERYDEWLDEAYGSFNILEASYAASEVLYRVDPTAYAEGFEQYKLTDATSDDK